MTHVNRRPNSYLYAQARSAVDAVYVVGRYLKEIITENLMIKLALYQKFSEVLRKIAFKSHSCCK